MSEAGDEQADGVGADEVLGVRVLRVVDALEHGELEAVHEVGEQLVAARREYLEVLHAVDHLSRLSTTSYKNYNYN